MVSISSAPGPFGQFRALSWKLKLPALFSAALVLILSLTALLNAFNYSVGERTGIIGKLSTKGILCWTNEGQLAMPNFSMPAGRSGNANFDNTFYFSVPDPDVQKQLQALPPGSPVSLQYHQKLFALYLPLPFLCVRRTEYEIVGVRLAPAYEPNSGVRP
jgi:hypothetical protein